MLIEFRCSNLSDFDASKGRYIACDELVVAADDKIGQLLKCPKCGQMVEVPFDYVGAEEARQERSSTSSRSSNQGVSRSSPKSSEEALFGESAQINTGRVTNSSGQPLGSEPFEETEGLVSDDGQPRSVHDLKRKRCPDCGSALADNGKCSLCPYVEPKFNSKSAALDEIDIQLAGFQLWVSQIVSDGASIRWVAGFVTALFCLVYMVLMPIALLVGGIGGIVAAVCLTLGFVFYILAVVKAWQLTKDPRARLSFLQRPFWNLLLFGARLLRWEKYDAQYTGRKIINLRNAPIVDAKVAYIEDLKKCQVLDLENTLITDDGLEPLYGHKHLHCLVVRRTAVTPEGVFRLQQANPRLWIWD
ncbi:MAG: hypothetical protein MK106_07615 [Mariniblastus sp.]|nr:hypothetical protein [Mariniblastus sp.]